MQLFDEPKGYCDNQVHAPPVVNHTMAICSGSVTCSWQFTWHDVSKEPSTGCRYLENSPGLLPTRGLQLVVG